MIRLCTTVWKSFGFVVNNFKLYRDHQTTRLQHVAVGHLGSTARFVDLFGSNRVNPQSTALITVIRFINRLSHSITVHAHITQSKAVR